MGQSGISKRKALSNIIGIAVASQTAATSRKSHTLICAGPFITARECPQSKLASTNLDVRYWAKADVGIERVFSPSAASKSLLICGLAATTAEGSSAPSTCLP